MDAGLLDDALCLQIVQPQHRQPLRATLLADGAVSAEQVEVALGEAEQTGRRLGALGMRAANQQGVTTLRQDDVRLVLEGVSSVDEIRRVTGDRLV